MRTRYTYQCETCLTIDQPKIVNVGECEIRLEGGGKENTISRLDVTVPGGHADNEVVAHELSSFVANYLTAMHSDARFLILREAERVEILDASNDPSAPRTLSAGAGAFASGIGPLDEAAVKPEVVDRFYEFREPLSAYIEGLDARSELDKFRNFYRVIEWMFDDGDRRSGSTKERLKVSGLLEYITTLTRQAKRRKHLVLSNLGPEKSVEKIVDLRDQCSHLRNKKVRNFGYSTQDLQQLRDVRNWIPSVQMIARSIILDESKGSGESLPS